MKNNERKRRSKMASVKIRTFVTQRTRRSLLRQMREKRRLTIREDGEVTDVTSSTSKIAFGKGREMRSLQVPSWVMRYLWADLVGTKVRMTSCYIGPDMILTRLSRIGPRPKLEPARPKRRLTKKDIAMLELMMYQSPETE